MKPLAIDIFCGLGGWTEGLLAEGFDVIGFDIERHVYGDHRYPAQLVLQDVRTIDGAQFRNASLIVASPPCQEFSYMAMPWTRAKKIAAEYRDGTRDRAQLTALFDACFRIQREAIAAAGHFIPLVVENVRGAIPWVGRSRWNFGSFHLWGDVPALMPIVSRRSAMKVGDVGWRRDNEAEGGTKNPGGGSWDRDRPSHTTDHSWESGVKIGGPTDKMALSEDRRDEDGVKPSPLPRRAFHMWSGKRPTHRWQNGRPMRFSRPQAWQTLELR